MGRLLQDIITYLFIPEKWCTMGNSVYNKIEVQGRKQDVLSMFLEEKTTVYNSLFLNISQGLGQNFPETMFLVEIQYFALGKKKKVL